MVSRLGFEGLDTWRWSKGGVQGDGESGKMRAWGGRQGGESGPQHRLQAGKQRAEALTGNPCQPGGGVFPLLLS